MKSTHKHQKKFARKTNKVRLPLKKRGGGKTFAESGPVSLYFANQTVKCILCGQNNFTETIGTLGKSKVRQGFGSFFFGEAAEVLDTTSIITYFCNNCGLSKMIRNNDKLRILTSPVAAAPPAATAAAATAAAQAPATAAAAAI